MAYRPQHLVSVELVETISGIEQGASVSSVGLVAGVSLIKCCAWVGVKVVSSIIW
jgi:hypothetical protein